jgi:glutathione S-transferase
MLIMLTIWGRTNSLNVQKVMWTVAELGLPHRRIDAGLQFGVNNTPEYRAMNPNGLVPVIDDDGFVLWESNVIVRYLAARYGGDLMPSDVRQRALAERWMDWQTNGLYPAMVPVFVALVRTPPEKRDPAVVESGRKATERWLTVLDMALASRDYVNGAALTVGDIPVGVAVNRWYRMPVAREPHPNVEAWLERLRARPGFAKHADLPLS